MSITENQLEQQCLGWFREGDWETMFSPDIAHDGAVPERTNYREVELLEKLLRDEIKAHLRTNVVLQKKFGDHLLNALRKYHNRAIETAQVIEEVLKMADDFKDALSRNEGLGLNPDEIAFYDSLAERPEVLNTMGDATLKQLATELTEQLGKSTTVDWQVRDSVRAKMRILIKRTPQEVQISSRRAGRGGSRGVEAGRSAGG